MAHLRRQNAGDAYLPPSELDGDHGPRLQEAVTDDPQPRRGKVSDISVEGLERGFHERLDEWKVLGNLTGNRSLLHPGRIGIGRFAVKENCGRHESLSCGERPTSTSNRSSSIPCGQN
jgi:hypothetical protein